MLQMSTFSSQGISKQEEPVTWTNKSLDLHQFCALWERSSLFLQICRNPVRLFSRSSPEECCPLGYLESQSRALDLQTVELTRVYDLCFSMKKVEAK